MGLNESESKIKFLKNVAPFDSISETGLRQLAECFSVRKYKTRDTIIHQGDTTSDLYVIQRGFVRVLTINEEGEESCLRLFASLDVFGELSAFDNNPRSASVQAVGLCTILVMKNIDFIRFLGEQPDLALSFIRLLSERLRRTTLFSHTIAQYDTAGRLIHLLLHYMEEFGREISAGKIYEIALPLSQSDLASMVGARREWVNRLLQQWRKKGFITYSRGNITILDLAAFEAEKNRRYALSFDEKW